MNRKEYSQDECDPVALTQRLHVLTTVRDNLRAATIEKTGMIPQTPLLDASIEWLEDALALHLPGLEPSVGILH